MNLRATLKLLEDESTGEDPPVNSRRDQNNRDDPKPPKKERTQGQDLKSWITKASNKLTESKGWVKKLATNKVQPARTLFVVCCHVFICIMSTDLGFLVVPLLFLAGQMSCRNRC